MNKLIISENINQNQLINGILKNEEINGNIYDMTDESLSISESNVFKLNETLKQREALIKQLSERLQTTLQSRDDITKTAECMVTQIEELKQQLKTVSNTFLNKTTEVQPILQDFECQTEWADESSIEEARRQSSYQLLSLSQLSTPVGVNTFMSSFGAKNDSTVERKDICENWVQTDSDFLHIQCRQQLEELKHNLWLEFKEREKLIESKLSEQINQLEQQIKSDKALYNEENQKLDEELQTLKSYICDLEKQNKSEQFKVNEFADEEVPNFKSLSPFLSNAAQLHNQLETEPHTASRSPIFQTLQSCNNWSQTHPAYNAPPHESDIENIEYVAQTPIENSRLLHVLSDLVKTFIDTEHDIQKQLIDMGIENRITNREELQSFVSLNEDIVERLSESDLCEDGPDLTHNSSNTLYFTPPSGQNEVEEDVVLGASRRLRTAVDRILKLLSEIVSKQSEYDLISLQRRNEELLNELTEECQRRNTLTTQLLQIEDRVKTLEKEKTSLSEKVIDFNENKQQLETIKVKLNEYELERDKWLNDNKRLEEEKLSFSQGLPQLQKIIVSNTSTALNTALMTNTELVNDNESLNKDVQQLQQERIKLLQRIHALTLETEHLRSERDDILDEKRRDSEDFIAQIEANEKNIVSYRKFIDEQTHERELERDEYHKEVLNLREKIKERDKTESKLKSRFEEMETQISCLTEEKCYKEKQLNEMNSQLKTANNEIIELKAIVRQMERENDKSSQSERNLRSKIEALNGALELQIRLNEESQQEVLSNNLMEQITSKTQQLQNTLGSIECESESEDTSIDCSFTDIKILSEKMSALNECIDKLIVQNNGLKSELERLKNNKNQDLNELIKEKQSLERNLTEIFRSNEILKEELNSKHLQLSALKSRLESSLDSSDIKLIVEELQNKLLNSEQNKNKLEFEINSLKQQIDDKNTNISQLMNELSVFKRQMKAFDSEKSLLFKENDELRLKLSSKEAILSALKQSAEEKLSASSHLTQQMETYKKTIESYETERTSLAKLNEDLKTRISENEQIIGSLRQQIQENQRKERKLSETTDSLNAKLKVLNSDKNNLNKENTELKSKLCSVNAVLLSLNEQIDEKNNKTIELIDRVDSLSSKLKSVESEKVKYFKDNNDLKSKLNRFDQQIHELKCQISDEQFKSLRHIEEIDSLKTRLKVLESEKARLLKENSSLRAKLLSNEEVLNLLKQQLDERNRKIKHLNELIDKLKTNFLRFDSNENQREKETLNSSSAKLYAVHSDKTAEDEDKANGLSNQLLWKLKRVISHKNALIHQKKYLLHVLGGFQLTEKATLALLANMNVTVDDELPALKSYKSRFRSVVYTVIAISRMRLLVKKWKSRNHLKSKTNVAKTLSSNSLGASTELQTDSTLQEFVNRLQRLHDTLGLRSGQT